MITYNNHSDRGSIDVLITSNRFGNRTTVLYFFKDGTFGEVNQYEYPKHNPLRPYLTIFRRFKSARAAIKFFNSVK